MSKTGLEEDGYDQLAKWFESKFRFLPQLIISLSFGCLGLVSVILLLNNTPSAKQVLGIYLCTFLGMFGIGNGAYFALFMPTLVKTASEIRLNLYPYDPAKSKAVQVASSAYGVLTLGVGTAATVVMVLIFIFQPWQRSTTYLVTFAWLIIVYGLTAYTFVYPHVYISVGIEKEKRLQLDRLEILVRTYQEKIEDLSPDELDRMEKWIELRNQISQAKATPLRFSVWKNYITAVLLPTATFFLSFVDFQPVLQSLNLIP